MFRTHIHSAPQGKSTVQFNKTLPVNVRHCCTDSCTTSFARRHDDDDDDDGYLFWVVEIMIVMGQQGWPSLGRKKRNGRVMTQELM